MADKWPFDSKLDGGELVGRRVFSTSPSFSSTNLDPDVFDDSRMAAGLSLDRLGQGAAKPDVVKFLTPLADADATKQGTTFFGWAALRASKFKKVTLRPDKLTMAADGVDNPYHALLFAKNSIRDSADAHFVSRALFVDYHFSGGVFVDAVR